jgi:hypothetical protein
MAEGLTPSGAATALEALAAAYPWIKPHIGAPGAAATANAAVETTRKQAAWNSTGVDGIIDNSAQVQWTNVAASEDWTHFSAWTAATAGTCGFTGTITMNPLTAGDTVTVAAGALTASVTLAS